MNQKGFLSVKPEFSFVNESSESNDEQEDETIQVKPEDGWGLDSKHITLGFSNSCSNSNDKEEDETDPTKPEDGWRLVSKHITLEKVLQLYGQVTQL